MLFLVVPTPIRSCQTLHVGVYFPNFSSFAKGSAVTEGDSNHICLLSVIVIIVGYPNSEDFFNFS